MYPEYHANPLISFTMAKESSLDHPALLRLMFQPANLISSFAASRKKSACFSFVKLKTRPKIDSATKPIKKQTIQHVARSDRE